MSARLSDGFYAGDTHHTANPRAAAADTEWSVLPDAWPQAEAPLLTAREVVGVTLAIVIATVLALFGLG